MSAEGCDLPARRKEREKMGWSSWVASLSLVIQPVLLLYTNDEVNTHKIQLNREGKKHVEVVTISVLRGRGGGIDGHTSLVDFFPANKSFVRLKEYP